jgi:hypothetical protein
LFYISDIINQNAVEEEKEEWHGRLNEQQQQQTNKHNGT